jgi:DNA-directed RNA polymerase alpha subunit
VDWLTNPRANRATPMATDQEDIEPDASIIALGEAKLLESLYEPEAKEAEVESYNDRLLSALRAMPLVDRLKLRVDDLELSVRTYNCLTNAVIQTIGDRVQRGENGLLRLRNFGRRSLYEIRDMLNGLNLQLGMTLNEETLVQLAKAKAREGEEGPQPNRE